MFFQLSLPSTAPGTEAGDEPATLELHGPGTLTLPSVHVAGGRRSRPVARLRLAPARAAKGALRVDVAAPCVAVTYTAERAGAAISGPDWPLQ